MENSQPTTNQPVIPPPEPIQSPIPAPEPKKLNTKHLMGVALVLLVSIVLVLFAWSRRAPVTEEATVIPTVIPTIVPQLHLSALATTSAFNIFSETLASYSAAVSSFSLQDGALTPPALDLDITLKP